MISLDERVYTSNFRIRYSPNYLLFKDVYDELSRLVTGSNVGVLEGDADNIVDYIIDSLKKLTSSIEVKVMRNDNARQFKTENCLKPK